MKLCSTVTSRTLFLLVSLLCCALAVDSRPLRSPPHRALRHGREDESAAAHSLATSSASTDFTVQVNPATWTVSSVGDEISGVVTLTGTGGFIGTVDVSCEVSPAVINPAFCFLYGDQVGVDSTSSPSTVILVAGAIAPSCLDYTGGEMHGNPGGGSRLLTEVGAGLIALTMLACSTRLVSAAYRTKFAWSAIICAAGLVMSGCGGSNNSGFQCSTGVPNAGTPAGLYTMTVTATSGSISHTATVPLTVTSPF